MKRPLLKSGAPFRLGDVVAGQSVIGTVVTVRDCGPGRQVLGVKQADGKMMFVSAEVPPDLRIPAPVDLAAATSLARLIMSGTDPRLPADAVQHTLAATVLMLVARLAEEVVP